MTGGRTVFLSYWYPPANVPRAIQVGRLVAHLGGRDVVVWTGHEGGDAAVGASGRIERASGGRGRLERRLLDVLRVPDAYLGWAVRTASRLQRREHLTPDDVLVTFGQPMSDHVAGLLLRRRTGVRWVAHFSDPWASNPFNRTTGWRGAVNRRLETAVLERADRVIVTCDEAREAVVGERGPEVAAKMVVIPHAYGDRTAGATDAPSDDGKLVARSVGSFYGIRTPAPLIDALRWVTTRDPALTAAWRIELVGAIERGMAQTVVPPMAVVPPVPNERARQLMKDADLLVVVDAPMDRSVFLPSKLIEYVGAGRPIVALTPPGPAARLVEELGGWVGDPGDPEAAGRALAAGMRAATADGSWGRSEVRERFAAERVAASVAALLDELG